MDLSDIQQPDILGAEAFRGEVDRAAVVARAVYVDDAAGDAAVTGEALSSDKKATAKDAEGSPQKMTKKERETLTRARLDTTHHGFGLRLVHYSKGEVIYCPQLGWLTWDGRRFLACDESDTYVRQRLVDMRNKIFKEEYPALMQATPKPFVSSSVIKKYCSDEDLSKEDFQNRVEHLSGGDSERFFQQKHKAGISQAKSLWTKTTSLGNNNPQNSVLRVSQSIEDFYTEFDDLDVAGGVVTVANGALDLPLDKPTKSVRDPETGLVLDDDLEVEILAGLSALKLRRARPKDKMTRTCAARFDKAAWDKDDDICPRWDKHIRTVLPSEEMRRFAQRVFGSMLVNFNPENEWFILRGPGGDGKSTTYNAIAHAVGDLAKTGNVKTIMADPRANASGPRNDLMDLAGGNRMVLFPEPSQDEVLDAGLLKTLTGGDEISARGNHQSQKTWQAQFKVILMCNDLPRVKSNDDGFWRRPVMLPFDQQFSKDQIDPGILGKLKSEADGILLWLLQGFFDWRARGFRYDPPAAAIEAKNVFRSEADPFAAWMDDRIIWGEWWNRDSLKNITLRAEEYDGCHDYLEAVTAGLQDVIDVAKRDYLTRDPNVVKAPRYTPTEIYQDFQQWCSETGVNEWTSGTFSKRFATQARDKGAVNKRSGDGRYWTQFDFRRARAQHVTDRGLADDEDLALRSGIEI